MKYRDMRGLPSSVAVWLEQQLEELGIDSGHYTRYVLSLLQDESGEHPPAFTKGVSKSYNAKKNSNLEDLKRSAIVECLSGATSNQSIDIENLVDELCTRLNAVNSSAWNNAGNNCLKETTNSEEAKKKFNISSDFPALSSPNRNTSAFPELNRETERVECSLLENTAWTKNICRVLGRRRDSESSPKENKITKRKEGNKENARGRLRSRSTVKSQSSSRSQRSGMATSLDRSNKKVGLFGGREDRHWIFTREYELEERDLPMDFQSLLQSPPEASRWNHMPSRAPGGPVSSQFIQHGTNITSSIWTAEKMDDDDSIPWDDCVASYVGWSNCRKSLLSSSWKHPFDYTIPSTILDNYRQRDIEGTALNLSVQGPSKYFSLFAHNSSTQIDFNSLTAMLFKEDSTVRKENEPTEQLENLLTSMKTHFKPIKEEPDGLSNNSENNNKYNDGVTFINVACHQEIKFHRSASGSLCLGSSDEKYMEFHRKDLVDPSFVPKFKVLCVNEKECQTEDFILREPETFFEKIPTSEAVDNFFSFGRSIPKGNFPPKIVNERPILGKELVSSNIETDFFIAGQNSIQVLSEGTAVMEKDEIPEETNEAEQKPYEHDSEFYFPGDEGCYAQIMDSETAGIQVRGTFTAFPLSFSEGTGRIPSPRMLNEIWSNYAPWVSGMTSENEKMTRSQDYSRLVDEVTAEGEQLLSDLSMHLHQDPRAQPTLFGFKTSSRH